MDAVIDALIAAGEKGLIPAGRAVLLAVSGGADSMALLYAAAEIAPRMAWTLAVAHVHHGWRGREADRDLAFVAGHARRLGLPFHARRRDARAAARELGLSPEAAARHVRYAALAEMAREAGAARVATAHQRDDAVESHLIARERSGGLAALAGPRTLREDGVVRPLLGVGRGEILAFLAERGLPYRRDASNGNLRLARNRVRRSLARLREAPGGDEAVRAIGEELERLAAERRRLDAEFEERVRPAIRTLPDAVDADAAVLAALPAELLRLALTRLASPFARPGRPPMTGRERERLLDLIAGGGDFRFEAGRRIRFERRRGRLRVRARDAAAVYDDSRANATSDASREVVE